MNMALQRQAEESDFPVIPLLLPSSILFWAFSARIHGSIFEPHRMILS